MKNKPILFSAPMVQAILAGRKTQTRRIADIPVYDHFGTDILDWGLSEHPSLKDDKWQYEIQTAVDDSSTVELKSKYAIGDILWVRETFNDDPEYYYFYKADFPMHWDADQTAHGEPVILEVKDYKWKPAIFMPKDACRIFLKVTDVRIEKLNDISEEDSIAEGIKTISLHSGNFYHYEREENHPENWTSPDYAYKELWKKINGPESWEKNPWVWVVTFERTDKPKNFE